MRSRGQMKISILHIAILVNVVGCGGPEAVPTVATPAGACGASMEYESTTKALSECVGEAGASLKDQDGRLRAGCVRTGDSWVRCRASADFCIGNNIAVVATKDGSRFVCTDAPVETLLKSTYGGA